MNIKKDPDATAKQKLSGYFKENFKTFEIQKRHFCNWDIKLRFDLQQGETDTD